MHACMHADNASPCHGLHDHACIEVQAVDAAVLARDTVCQLPHRVVAGLVQLEERKGTLLRVQPGVARGPNDSATSLGEPVGGGVTDAC